jgi:glucosamine 6-phosphate synthetase-like amidotransferase/phosphosugar isomerase protein
VSQSGESGEIITLVRNISKTKKNLITVGISNTSESQLAENVDILFEIKAGTETSVTSKTFTNSLLILFLLSVYLVNNFSVPREIFNEVNDMIGYIKKLFKDLDTKLEMITKIISFFGGTPEFLEILSSGPSLATAFQAALIYKEITKNYSEAHITSSFYHGGIECLKEDSCLVLISSDEINFKLNVHLIKNMREWKVGKILHISNYNIETISDDFGFDVGNLIQDKKNVYSITHKITNPFLAPICEIVFLQLLFYKMAENEIIEPGKFRFSSKITKELK